MTPSSCALRLVPALAILLPAGATAADSISRGTVSLEARSFNPDDFEETEDAGVALTTALEIKYRNRNGQWAAVLRGFGRFDALDDTRNIVDLESAYVSYSIKAVSLLAGVQILNWTATEAFHPADVMNSPVKRTRARTSGDSHSVAGLRRDDAHTRRSAPPATIAHAS